jgi:hypothetical protein
MLHPPRTDLSLAMRPSRLPSDSDKSEKKPERSARHATVHPACTATTAAFGTIPKCGSPGPREYGRTDLKADVTLLAFHWTPQVIAPLGEEDDHAQSGKYM